MIEDSKDQRSNNSKIQIYENDQRFKDRRSKSNDRRFERSNNSKIQYAKMIENSKIEDRR